MKYLRDSFSTGENSASYRDGWERVFGKTYTACSFCKKTVFLNSVDIVTNLSGVFCNESCFNAFVEEDTKC